MISTRSFIFGGDHEFTKALSKVHEVIVHFLPGLFKSGNDTGHFFSRALSTAAPRSQIIVHLVRLSIDRRHMSSRCPAAAVGPWCGARSCLLRCPSRSAYCCSAAVLKATTRSAKSSAPTSACVTASVRVYREGGRPTTTSPQCVPHMQNTHCGLLHAPCKQRQPIRPSPQHVELLRTKAEAVRLQLSD